jgi:hypothetical protein
VIFSFIHPTNKQTRRAALMDNLIILLQNSAWAIVALLIVAAVFVLIARWVDGGTRQVSLLADPAFYVAVSILVLVAVSMFRQPLLLVAALIALLVARRLIVRRSPTGNSQISLSFK